MIDFEGKVIKLMKEGKTLLFRGSDSATVASKMLYKAGMTTPVIRVKSADDIKLRINKPGQHILVLEEPRVLVRAKVPVIVAVHDGNIIGVTTTLE